MITLKDVAEECGKSVSTVSNILANPKSNRYGEKTCRKVMEAARKVGYVRNNLAQGLLSGKSGMIGVIIYSHYTTDMFLKALYKEIWKSGKTILVAACQPEPDLVYKAVRKCIASRCEAIIFANTAWHLPEKGIDLCRKHDVKMISFGQLRDEHSPVQVLFDSNSEAEGKENLSSVGNGKFSVVDTDRISAFKKATLSLLKSKPEKIKLVLALDMKIQRPRVQGFKEALNEAGIPFDNSMLVYLPLIFGDSIKNYLEGGFNAARKWAEDYASLAKGTAFLAYNDSCASGLLRGFVDAGLNVPEDIQIIGYDDHTLCSVTSPSLSSIKPDFDGLAKVALKMCGSRKSGTELLSAKIIFRNSTKK